jgi:hypothetical protein
MVAERVGKAPDAPTVAVGDAFHGPEGGLVVVDGAGASPTDSHGAMLVLTGSGAEAFSVIVPV